MRSLSTNPSNSPFPPVPRSVARVTRTIRPPARAVSTKPQVTPSASWGTGKGRTRIPPTGNSVPSKGRRGPDAAARERIFRVKGRRFFSCSRIGTSCRAQQSTAAGWIWSPCRWETSNASISSQERPASARARLSPFREGIPASTSRRVSPCSTSVRFPELPLRSGRTEKFLVNGEKLQPETRVEGAGGPNPFDLQHHRLHHEKHLPLLPDAAGQDLPPSPEGGVQVDR